MAHGQPVPEGHLERHHQGLKVEKIRTHVLELANDDGVHTDGTIEWSSVTMVLAECWAESVRGIGYSYTSPAAREIIDSTLKQVVLGMNPLDTQLALSRMLHVVRNLGRAGVVATAISALDMALLDLKARLLDVSVTELLGSAREHVPAYASGGFTSSNLGELERELAGYREQGFGAVKIKLGRVPVDDVDRVRVARAVLGPDIQLMVDANGAYSPRQALALVDAIAKYDVCWFEEPVSSDDLHGLAQLRERAPQGMAIAAGEYGYDSFYFERMLAAGAVDVLQADATRCLGASGFMQAHALCDARNRPLSSHCAPAIHASLALACSRVMHVEYFRDHARLESLLFDGLDVPRDGRYRLLRDRRGFGLEPRQGELARHSA
jgi:L-alanine-DL-glutamate epimerase-like enolase superfamily enzyme